MKNKILAIVLVVVVAAVGLGVYASEKEEIPIGKWELDYERIGASVDESKAIVNIEIIDDSVFTIAIGNRDTEPLDTTYGKYELTDGNFVLKVNDKIVSTDLAETDDGYLEWNTYPMKKVNAFTYDSSYFNNKQVQQTQENKVAQTTAPAASTTPTEYTFTAGNYAVGADIAPGTYDIELVSGSGNLYAGSPSNSVIEIFGDRDGYIKEFKNAKLQTGGTVEVKGTLEIRFVKK